MTAGVILIIFGTVIVSSGILLFYISIDFAVKCDTTDAQLDRLFQSEPSQCLRSGLFFLLAVIFSGSGVTILKIGMKRRSNRLGVQETDTKKERSIFFDTLLFEGIFVSLGIIFLGIGILFITIWNSSIDKLIEDGSVRVDSVDIKPNNFTKMTIRVSNLDPQLLMAVYSNSSKIELEEQLKNPKGDILNTTRFSQEFFNTFKPNAKGNYTLTVFNKDIEPVEISAFFGYLTLDKTENDNLVGSLIPRENLGGTLLLIIGTVFILGGLVSRLISLVGRGR
jgi:hypothetical protein